MKKMSTDLPPKNKAKKSHSKSSNEPKITLRNDTLSALMQIHQLSVRGLASKAGMARATVSRIFHYKEEPSLKDLLRISKALGVDSRFIFPDRDVEWWEKAKEKALKEETDKIKAIKKENLNLDEEKLDGFY